MAYFARSDFARWETKLAAITCLVGLGVSIISLLTNDLDSMPRTAVLLYKFGVTTSLLGVVITAVGFAMLYYYRATPLSAQVAVVPKALADIN